MGGKGGDRVSAARPDQVFGQFPFDFGDGVVPLHHFGVDDSQVQAGLDAVVEENGVENFAAGRGQAERYIGDTEDGFGMGQGFLNQLDAGNGFGGGADIVGVAGTGGKDEGVKDDVLLRDAVLLGEQGVGAEGDFQFALAGDGLGLLFVVVDAADDEGRAVGPGQGGDGLETGFAILEVHRVDDGFALQPFQRFGDNPGVGGVEHNGGFDLFGHQIEEGGNIGKFVPVGVLQADVEDMGAVADLAAADFGGFLESAAGNEAAETAAAEDVGALADYYRAGILVND